MCVMRVVCVCVLCVQCASPTPHQQWAGRAAERCLDVTSSVLVLVLVCVSQNAPPALGWHGGVRCEGVCVPGCSSYRRLI